VSKGTTREHKDRVLKWQARTQLWSDLRRSADQATQDIEARKKAEARSWNAWSRRKQFKSVSD
jgi:hypothetical protein